MSKRTWKNINSPVVENKDSHRPVSDAELKAQIKKMHEQFGNSVLPAVIYKGRTIPKRVLSNFSFLNADIQH